MGTEWLKYEAVWQNTEYEIEISETLSFRTISIVLV
jgi:hypothetical protein